MGFFPRFDDPFCSVFALMATWYHLHGEEMRREVNTHCGASARVDCSAQCGRDREMPCKVLASSQQHGAYLHEAQVEHGCRAKPNGTSDTESEPIFPLVVKVAYSQALKVPGNPDHDKDNAAAGKDYRCSCRIVELLLGGFEHDDQKDSFPKTVKSNHQIDDHDDAEKVRTSIPRRTRILVEHAFG